MILLYTLHSATTENRTSPECHRSKAKIQKGLLFFFKSRVGSLKRRSRRSDGMYVPDPSVSSRQQACSPTICTSVPGLWLPFFLLLWLPRVHKLAVYLDLCLIFLLLRFSLKSRHKTHPLLSSPRSSLSSPSKCAHNTHRVVERSSTTFYCLVFHPWL